MSIATATYELIRVVQFLRKLMKSPNVNVDEARAEILISVLPNEILQHIFRFLEHKDLLSAEQVCRQWKPVVETCFATEKRLNLFFGYYDEDFNYIYHLKHYGSSIKTLRVVFHEAGPCFMDNFAEEIADRFRNLLTMELQSILISDDGFNKLSTKCRQLENVSLLNCEFNTEGLKIFLRALTGIKVLNMTNYEYHIGPNRIDLTTSVFATFRNLRSLTLTGNVFFCTKSNFSRFCKECVTLRNLCIRHSKMPRQMLASIKHCSLLEKLVLDGCRKVVDWTLIQISQGCPNLRLASFSSLPLISDEGLKCFARCTNLNVFGAQGVKMTDETLVELSKCVNLRQVTLWSYAMVSDRGCAALLAHCPRLELLDVSYCEGVSNATVDMAIEAVECRQNGLVLELKLQDSSVTPEKYENCHPLLRLSGD